MERYKVTATVTLAALFVLLLTWNSTSGALVYVAAAVFFFGGIVWLMQLADAAPPADAKERWTRIAMISLIMLPSAALLCMLLWGMASMALGLRRYDDNWPIALVMAAPFLLTACFAWTPCRIALTRSAPQA